MKYKRKAKITFCACCKKIKLCTYWCVSALIGGINFNISETGTITETVEGYFCKECRKKSSHEIFVKLCPRGYVPEILFVDGKKIY